MCDNWEKASKEIYEFAMKNCYKNNKISTCTENILCYDFIVAL